MDEWLAYRPHNIHQLLHQLIMSTFGQVKFGFDSQVDIKGKGIIMLQRDDGHTLTIKNVVFISSLKVNIHNLGQMDEHGCKILMEGGQPNYPQPRRHSLGKGSINCLASIHPKINSFEDMSEG